MKRSFSLILCLVLVLSLLASCMSNVEQEHKHTYSATWSSNEAGHWYAATCEHTDLKANMSTHVDPANDGVCDVCGYGSDHVHTFDTANWSSDENNHWNAVTCGHNVTPQNKGAHTDTNNDGACDTCGYNGGHAHAVKNEWTFDTTDHWHAVTCGHDVVVDKAAHADTDKDGICDVCAHDVTKHDTPPHTHTWATTWSKDAEGHWYVGTCEHTGAINSYGLHIGTADDGVCDTCGWFDAGHTHTYNTGVWAKDDTNHWNPASCGHTSLKTNVAAHEDTDNNGACDTCGYTAHEHTFSDAWTNDAENHWHAATCPDCSAVTMVTPHHGMGDGICDACGYMNYSTDHDHEYNAEWTNDEDAHWKACTDHEEVIFNYGYHEDADDDGYCDVCGYTDMADDHNHTWANATDWVAGPDSHWHAADCHSFYKADEEAHTDAEADGICDVCEGVIFDSIIEEAISDEVANAINGGRIEITETYTDYYEGLMTESSALSFEIGNKYFHSLSLNGTEEWYSSYVVNGADGPVEKIFAIYDYDATDFTNTLSSKYGATLDNLNGYAFDLNGTYQGYGISDIIAVLYAAAGEQVYVEKTATEGDYGDTTYSFSFITGSYYMYLYGVSFTLSVSEGGQTYISEATITTAMYYKSDLTEKTNENGTYYVLNADSVANSAITYTVTQNAGARTATNEMPADNYLANSFDLVDGEGNPVANGDTIEMPLGGENVQLFFDNVTPSSAEFSMDYAEYVTKNADGEEVYDVEVYLNSDYYTGEYYLEFCQNWSATAGVYTVEITTSKATFTVVVNLVAPPLEALSSQVSFGDGWLSGDAVDMIVGMTFKYEMLATPEAANTECTYAVTSGDAANLVFGETEPDWFDNVYPTVTANATGTYVITFTSVENPEITCTMTLNVKEPPTVADVLQGKLYASFYSYIDYVDKMVIVEFTPAEEGADNGTVTFNLDGTTVTVNYAWDEINGVVLTNTDNSAYTDMELIIEADYSLTLFIAAEGDAFALAEYSAAVALAGTYKYFEDPNDPYYATYTITLYDDGTGEFGNINWEYEGFAFEIEEQIDGSCTIVITELMPYGWCANPSEFDETSTITLETDGTLTVTLTTGTFVLELAYR